MGLGLSLTVMFVACGKSARHGQPSAADDGGEPGSSGAASVPGGSGAPDEVPGGGGDAARGGAGGEAGGPAELAGMAGVGGEAPFPPGDLIEVLVPPDLPAEIVSGEGQDRLRVTLEPTDIASTHAEDLFVNQDGSVIVGVWASTVYRPRSTASFGGMVQAFRWSPQGTESLIDDSESVRSAPLGMSRDGSVVYVLSETFAGAQRICRWTEVSGCQPLGTVAVSRFEVSSYSEWRWQHMSVSRDGSYLALSATVDNARAVVRWSAESGWELVKDYDFRGIDEAGSVLLSGEGGMLLWELQAQPVAMVAPPGFQFCEVLWSESGSLFVGRCQNISTLAQQAVRWPTPLTPEPWAGTFLPWGINPNASTVTGVSPLPEQTDEQYAWARWSEADGLQVVLQPPTPEMSMSSPDVSDDGQVVFGQARDQVADVEHWFRWSKQAGSSELEAPASSVRMDLTLANRDGSVLGGFSYAGTDLSRAYATLWDEQGARVIRQQVEDLGFDLRGFEPEGISFIGEGTPLLVIGRGRHPPIAGGGPASKWAGSVWIAHLPAP